MLSPEIAAAAPPMTAAQERARKVRAAYSEGPLVTVAAARHQAEAEFLQGMLLEEGIPSLVRRSGGFDVPDFLAAGPRDVLVPQSGALGRPRRARRPGAAAEPAAERHLQPWVRALAAALAVLIIASSPPASSPRSRRDLDPLRPPGRARPRRLRALFVVDDSTKWDAFAMCVGAGLSVPLINVLFRFGAKGDEERAREDAAREYLAEHGHWPDEE